MVSWLAFFLVHTAAGLLGAVVIALLLWVW